MAPTQPTEDYYAVLEIPNTATAEHIRSSYRRLALSLHPDKDIKNRNATEAFQRVSDAIYLTVSSHQRVYNN